MQVRLISFVDGKAVVNADEVHTAAATATAAHCIKVTCFLQEALKWGL